MSLWQQVHHRDRRAVEMADRHYSRQKPGTPEFTRPGHKIVLLHFLPDGTPAALWASQRPSPDSGIKRADGLNAWDCSVFRVEHRTVPASELIGEAVCITRYFWGDLMPADGFVTTVNPHKVQTIKRRGKTVHGFSFQKAGWQELKITKTRKLVMLQLPLSDVWQFRPIEPAFNIGGMFGMEVFSK